MELNNNNILNISDDYNLNFYIILGSIIIIIIILNFINYNKKINLNDNPIQLIKETHETCPVMGGNTSLSSCVQYPPLNQGFIISVCCKDCIEKIQSSFDNGDGEFVIKEENNMNILYRNNTLKQITPICNEDNMHVVIDLVNTKIM